MKNDAPYIPARDHSSQSCAVPCSACEAWTNAAQEDEVTCQACGATQNIDWSAHVDDQGTLDGCPRCDYHTLCIQKDINPRFGVVLVSVTFAALFFSGLSIPWMLVGLVLLSLVDWLVLRLLIKRLLICYRCKAQYRGFPPGARCRPFDLATWEAHTPPPTG